MANLLTAFPGYGSIQIGGWSPNSFTETSVDVKAVPSLDGRTISYSEITISIHAKVVSDVVGLAPLEIAFALPRLQKSGVNIVYKGRGFDRILGALGANTRDIAWGPMPGSLRIKPRGGVPANAFDVLFTITAKVPTCYTARFYGPIDLATSITFDVDYAGYLTRTYAGRLRIANNLRPDGRGGTDSPDLYREDVTPALMPGFYRKFGPWTTSEDKTELSFSVIDEELPGLNVPPEWVVGQPVLSHTVSSTPQPGLKRYIARFSGHYEISKDSPDSLWPAKHFFDVFLFGPNGRITSLEKNLRTNRGSGTASAIMPIAIEFGEPNLLGPRVFDFSISFTHVDDLKSVIGNAGMWKPLPGSNWKTWAKSLSASAFNPYGTAQAVFNIGDDTTITGLCSPLPISNAGKTNRILRSPGDSFDDEEWVERVLRGVKPDNSWLEYENTLHVLPATGTVVLRTLPTQPVSAGATLTAAVAGAAGAANAGLGAVLANALGGAANAINAPVGPQVGGGLVAIAAAAAAARGGAESLQKRTEDSFRVVMEGHAIRAGFEIPPPVLLEVGGVPATPLFEQGADYWTQKIVANWGMEIFGASWRFTYWVDGPLKKPIEVAPNPMLGWLG